MRKEQIQREAGYPMPMPGVEGAKTAKKEAAKHLASVYCPFCTRTVQAVVMVETNTVYRKALLSVVPGQKCPRCNSSLDAGFVLGTNN